MGNSSSKTDELHQQPPPTTTAAVTTAELKPPPPTAAASRSNSMNVSSCDVMISYAHDDIDAMRRLKGDSLFFSS